MKSLFIDLEACRACGECRAPCSYPLHPANDGISACREAAEFRVTCRRCVNAPCVRACPAGALRRTAAGHPERRTDRCVQCLSCAAACPFGVILPELLQRPPSVCDFCAPRLTPGGDVPVCVTGCPEGAVQYGDFEAEPARNRFRAADTLVVHAFAWRPPEGR